MRKSKPVVLRAVRPNAGIEAAYRRRLIVLVEAMHKSVSRWVKAAYRAREPQIALDAAVEGPEITVKPHRLASGQRVHLAYVDGAPLTDKRGNARRFKTEEAARAAAAADLPAIELTATVNDLAQRWQGKFDEASENLARTFAGAASRQTDATLRTILRDGGISVDFQMTPAAANIIEATVSANVDLIKSIPQQYLSKVNGMVMRSVQTGRDIGQLSRDLQQQLGVTKRRASFISIDQSNKATSAIQRARQTELGITEAIWMHSGGGKHPRPTHVAMNGKRYDVAKGMWDPAVKRYIFPGEEINCRCVSKSIIAGF